MRLLLRDYFKYSKISVSLSTFKFIQLKFTFNCQPIINRCIYEAQRSFARSFVGFIEACRNYNYICILFVCSIYLWVLVHLRLVFLMWMWCIVSCMMNLSKSTETTFICSRMWDKHSLREKKMCVRNTLHDRMLPFSMLYITFKFRNRSEIFFKSNESVAWDHVLFNFTVLRHTHLLYCVFSFVNFIHFFVLTVFFSLSIIINLFF